MPRGSNWALFDECLEKFSVFRPERNEGHIRVA